MFAQGILLLLDYTNREGERVRRLVRPLRLEAGAPAWHRLAGQMVLVAEDARTGSPVRVIPAACVYAVTTVRECPHCRGARQTAGLDCACEAAAGMVAEGCPHD